MDRVKGVQESLTNKNKYVFNHIDQAPPDPILGTNTAFNNDKDPKKVNLGIGAYRDDEGKPVVFKAVQKAERLIIDNKSINKEYLPISGFAVGLF